RRGALPLGPLLPARGGERCDHEGARGGGQELAARELVGVAHRSVLPLDCEPSSQGGPRPQSAIDVPAKRQSGRWLPIASFGRPPLSVAPPRRRPSTSPRGVCTICPFAGCLRAAAAPHPGHLACTASGSLFVTRACRAPEESRHDPLRRSP